MAHRARGLQKEQSQQKAKAKADAAKGGNSLIGKDKGLKYKCSSCMQEIDSLSSEFKTIVVLHVVALQRTFADEIWDLVLALTQT